MEFPVKIEIEIRNQEDLDMWTKHSAELPHVLMSRTKYRRMNPNKEARVIISGKTISTGTIEDMLKRFKMECGMHRQSNILVQQWENGDFKTVQARRIQRNVV